MQVCLHNCLEFEAINGDEYSKNEYNDNEIEDIYDQLHPVRQKLVIPVEKPWRLRLAEWKDIPYAGKEFSENIPVIYTKKGERVQSKSEKMISKYIF